jgi:3-(3-hydroxy-phenyl)propionate hydroxylase
LTGGIHYAFNVVGRRGAVWRGVPPDSELGRFDKQRRLVTLEYIQKYSIQNKRNLESSGEEFGASLRAIAAEPARTREYLLRTSMIASLARAAELG